MLTVENIFIDVA